MTVYLDEVFVVNLVMDWLILWAVGNLDDRVDGDFK